MICPNCNRNLDDPQEPDFLLDDYGHANGCLLSVMLTVLSDRGHDVSDADLTKIDADQLWERFGGPAADFVAEQLGLPAYP